jgi:hypothetical protein
VDFWTAWGVAAVVACGLVAVVATRRRVHARRWAWGLGIAAAVTLGGWLWWDQANRQQSVWVFDINEQQIALHIEHYRIRVTGTEYVFTPIMPANQLWQAVRDQYPDATIDGSVARIFRDNQYITLTPVGSDTDEYRLALEYVSVWTGDTGHMIPFPAYAITGEYGIETDAGLDGNIPTSCDTTCLANYYQPFTNVTRDGDTFTITTPGTTADIAYAGGRATIRIRP